MAGKNRTEGHPKSFLGFDFSTQGVKAVIINEKLEILQEAYVNFDSDLSEFGTSGGFHMGDDGKVVTSPTIMWVKGLDTAMVKLRTVGAVFSSIVAISGCTQQHSTIYWQKGALEKLSSLRANQPMHEQLMSGCFSLKDTPIWMDISTTPYCKQLEEAIGGKERLASLTGSRACERFGGLRILKLFSENPEIYKNTERISLISSFVCSLFIGKYAPIDFSDGSGMNLLNIHTKDWDDECLKICGSDLRKKLGSPVSNLDIVGNISQYFVNRHEFSPECKVAAFTGDNCASLVGLRLKKGDIGFNLGTGDSMILPADKPLTFIDGNTFINPVDSNIFMGLLGWRNGSLAREHLRDTLFHGSWREFDKALKCNPIGNFGNIGMYYFNPEILPFVKGTFCFPLVDSKVENQGKLTEPSYLKSFERPETEVRGLIEGQFLSKKLYTIRCGIDKISRIIVAGGASCNTDILQVASDVFNVPVYKLNTVNLGCLGSALIAKCAYEGGHSFESSCGTSPLTLACEPNKDAEDIYNPMLIRYAKLHEFIEQKFTGVM